MSRPRHREDHGFASVFRRAAAGNAACSLPAPPRTRSGVGVAAAPTRWVRLLVRGREDDAAWVRPSLIGLLGIAALLYLWDLGASGWANAFYSAAVQAGFDELEGVLLRVLRRVELHHRGQVAGRVVGDGPVGARFRRQPAERPRPPGARGCGHLSASHYLIVRRWFPPRSGSDRRGGPWRSRPWRH